MNSIRINFDGNNGFGVLDPSLCIVQGSANILHNTLLGLMQFKGGSMVPGVAERYEATNENCIFTFHLRECFWSDGQPVTADDFAWSWRRVLQNEESPHRPYFAYIKGVQAFLDGHGSVDNIGIRAEGQQKLIVELEKPCPFFLALTASTPYLPVPPHAPESIGRVGNGSYTVKESEFDKIVLQSLDAAHPDIVATMCGDEEWIDQSFRNGSLDISDGLPHHASDYYRQANQLHYTSELGTFFLQFNLRSEVLQDPARRQKVHSCLQVEELVRRSEINEEPATSLVPWDFFLQREEFNPISFPKAESVGDEWNGTLELAVNNLEIYVSMAEIVKRQIEESSSYHVKIKPYEWDSLLEVLQAGTFDLVLNGWIADYFDPLSMLEIWKSDSEYNFSGYRSLEFDRLLERSKTETNQHARYEMLRQAEGILLHDIPLIPIYQYRIPMLKQSHIRHVVISPFGVFDFLSLELSGSDFHIEMKAGSESV